MWSYACKSECAQRVCRQNFSPSQTPRATLQHSHPHSLSGAWTHRRHAFVTPSHRHSLAFLGPSTTAWSLMSLLRSQTNSLRPSATSIPRQGRKPAAINAVQLRTPYESASFDDWEVRAEIEEQIKRKQARKAHEARRRGASVERRQSTQRFYAAEQAAYRERRAREEAHTHYLETVAVRLRLLIAPCLHNVTRSVPSNQRAPPTSPPVDLARPTRCSCRARQMLPTGCWLPRRRDSAST